MISQEPHISVGIIQNEKIVAGTCKGNFILGEEINFSGSFKAAAEGERVVLRDGHEREITQGRQILLRAQPGGSFILNNVTIGNQFHWQRNENEEFEGNLRLCALQGSIAALNEIGLERYLESVISSEMNAEAPIEFLKAHAIVSRSWLAAMLERKKKISTEKESAVRGRWDDEEIVRWYDREDHGVFDVCADDHCQRYQGITKIHTSAALRAVEETRGVFLMHNGEICDARFHKSCGGRTELFENNWDDTPVPVLAVRFRFAGNAFACSNRRRCTPLDYECARNTLSDRVLLSCEHDFSGPETSEKNSPRFRSGDCRLFPMEGGVSCPGVCSACRGKIRYRFRRDSGNHPAAAGPFGTNIPVEDRRNKAHDDCRQRAGNTEMVFSLTSPIGCFHSRYFGR